MYSLPGIADKEQRDVLWSCILLGLHSELPSNTVRVSHLPRASEESKRGISYELYLRRMERDDGNICDSDK